MTSIDTKDDKPLSLLLHNTPLNTLEEYIVDHNTIRVGPANVTNNIGIITPIAVLDQKCN